MWRSACEEQLEDAHPKDLPEFRFGLLSRAREHFGDEAIERASAPDDSGGDIHSQSAFSGRQLVAVCEIGEGVLKKTICTFCSWRAAHASTRPLAKGTGASSGGGGC
jgi:hypothetical protein